MDLTTARELATAKLRELETPGTPLLLDDGGTEIAWAWCFTFDSADFADSGAFQDMVFSGPIVVNKDGSDVWVAASAPPLEQRLNDYAAQHGYPPVPLPPVQNPFVHESHM